MYVYHLFFIHSSVMCTLVCFHILATINNIVMNIRVHALFWIGVFGFFQIYSRVKLLDRIIVQFLLFWEIVILFSMIIPIYISTNSVRGFSFLHIFTNNCVLFDDSHSDLCAVVPNCSFDSHFSNNYNDEPLFMCLLALCMSLETCLFKTSALKKKFFFIELYELSVYFEY